MFPEPYNVYVVYEIPGRGRDRCEGLGRDKFNARKYPPQAEWAHHIDPTTLGGKQSIANVFKFLRTYRSRASALE